MATIYGKKDNGDLHLIGEADVEEGTSAALLIDLLLDEETKLRSRNFIVFLPEGVFDVTVNGDEPVNPRRDISVEQVSGNSATKVKRSARKAEPEEEVEEAKPAPKRTTRKPAAKRAPAKKPAAKRAPAKKPANKLGGRKPAAKKNPLRKNAASAD